MAKLDILVEEPSAEAFLRTILPRLFQAHARVRCDVVPHQGKDDLIAKLPARLSAYGGKGLHDRRVIILVDRDAENCVHLRRRLNEIAARSGLIVRGIGDLNWRVATRIAIEELEAWYFGDWTAVCSAYPKAKLSNSERARNCDAIAGGTWEQLERVLQRAGYFSGGLRKIELARAVGKHFDPARCVSHSFRKFLEAVRGP